MSRGNEKSPNGIPEDEMGMSESNPNPKAEKPDMLNTVESPQPLTESSESGADIKASALDSVHKSQGFIERGSVPKEIVELGRSFVDVYKRPVESGFGAIKNLVTLNPKGVVREVVSGAKDSLISMLKIPTTHPIKLASAGVSSVARAGQAVLKAPVHAVEGIAKSPMWVWGKIEDWTNRLSRVSNRLAGARA